MGQLRGSFITLLQDVLRRLEMFPSNIVRVCFSHFQDRTYKRNISIKLVPITYKIDSDMSADRISKLDSGTPSAALLSRRSYV